MPLCCPVVAWGRNELLKLPEEQLHMYWYQWFFGAALAEERLMNERITFTRYIWSIWITGLANWQSNFEQTGKSFLNGDWVVITLHSYQVRWELAAKDHLYQKIDGEIEKDICIRVPTLVLRGDSDPVAVPQMYEGKEELFKNGYMLRRISNAGHFPQRENPQAVSDAILSFLK